VNLVLIILTALIAFAGVTSTQKPAPSAATITTLDATTAAPVVTTATDVPAPTPAPADVVVGSGPSH
jgi:ABC-type Fe3+-hydroxamate transport system substrate-binding protein